MSENSNAPTIKDAVAHARKLGLSVRVAIECKPYEDYFGLVWVLGLDDKGRLKRGECPLGEDSHLALGLMIEDAVGAWVNLPIDELYEI